MKKFLLAFGAVCLVSGSALSVGALAQDTKPKTVTKTFTVARNLTQSQQALRVELFTLRKTLAAAATPEAKALVQAQIDQVIEDAKADGMTIDQVNTVLAEVQTAEAVASIQESGTITNFDTQESETVATITITFVDPQSGYTPG